MTPKRKLIRFYRQDAPFGCFSNFSRHPVILKGKSWPTTEHYFQAQKYSGTPREEEIRTASRSPMIAKRMGNSRSHTIRPDWETVRDDVMREAVRAKFTQHADLRRTLLETGDAKLVEHTSRDSYWGDGGDGTGRNMLGRILMEIRGELRSAASGA